MQSIGERTEYYRKGESLYITIKSTVEGWKKVSLALWWAAWLICGIFIIKELANIEDKELRFFFFAFLSFWGYYIFRIGKVLVWRLFGQEFIMINSDKVIIKRAFRTYGRAQIYFIENITDFEIIKSSPTGFLKIMESSFWTMGAETLQFKNLGKYVRFGIQLAEGDSKNIYQLLAGELKKKRSLLKAKQKSESKS